MKRCRRDRSPAQVLGELMKVEDDGLRILLHGEGGSLALTAVNEHVLRVRSGREGRFAEDRSFAVSDEAREARIAPEVTDSAERVEVRFGGLRVIAARKPLGLSIYDHEDRLLVRENAPPGLHWQRERLTLTHLAEPGARYFGFGEKTGPLNKRGRSMLMWNNDFPFHSSYDPLYMSIPYTLVMLHGRAHGLFFDNPARCRFKVASGHPWFFEYSVDAGELDLYVIAGPKPAEVVSRYTALTGRAPMPPRWALGHHQCRWSYMNEAEVREIARNFRERDIPTDVIFMDIHYMDRYRVFTFDQKAFPDAPAMAADLRQQGFRLVASVDPGVAAAEDYPLYREGRDGGHFCKDASGEQFRCHVWPGRVGMPDFTDPETRRWWGDSHRPLLDAGIAGIWNDMNEPSVWRGSLRVKDLVIPFPQIKRPDIVHDDEGRNTPHLAIRNVYGLLENQAAFEGLTRLRPGVRPFILSRSGYAGVQKWAANWTGDNSSTFAHLALTVPMLLNLGLSGVAFCGPDIGGFAFNASPELYARWIELGAFYPYCRTHTAIRSRRQEPWSFGTRVTNIAREYLKLRYRLHPTTYSLFRECHETGAPVLRPMFYEFPGDRSLEEVQDQAMFGPSLLIAPVVNKGQRRRDVHLPEALWTDYWTGERITGPTVVSRDAPLELLPIYVRDGAVLFLWPPMDWLNQRPVDRLFIELYPPAMGRSEAVLYEDDGETDDYTRGVFAKRLVTQTREDDRLVIGIEAKDGPFVPPARDLILKVHLAEPPAAVSLDRKQLPLTERESCTYLTSERILRLSLPDDGAAHEIALRP